MELKFFADDESTHDLCVKYWERESESYFKWTLAELAQEFSLSNKKIHDKVNSNCRAISNDIKCNTCDVPYMFYSRQNFMRTELKADWVCMGCIDEANERLEQKKIKTISDSLVHSLNSPLLLDKLTARESILLLALVRFSATESLSDIEELETNQTDNFTPTDNYTLDIIQEMYRSNLIAIAPNSNLDAIELAEDGKFRFNLKSVRWALPLSPDCSTLNFITKLEERISSMEYIESDYDSIVLICREVSLAECFAFLDHVVLEHNMAFNPGNKTSLVFNKAIENFSVSQIYNFIWRAGKDAAAFYQRSGTSKKHAANTIISNIDRQLERALSENWDIKPFKRNYNIPQSTISRVIFNTLLHTNDGGFNNTLNKVI